MHHSTRRAAVSALIAASAIGLVSTRYEQTTRAEAAPPTKEQCLDAYGRGQDERTASLLTTARATFLVCAQPSCPQLVAAECVRFVDEIDRIQPTVTFTARNAAGQDMADTSVWVDGVLVAKQLDGGAVAMDPGRHEIRFVHEQRETTIVAVIQEGQKDRPILATFPSPSASTSSAPANTTETAAPRRPTTPLVVAGVGGALLVGGAVLAWVGAHQIPSNCSLSAKDCAAPAGDPSFEKAAQGTRLVDVGALVAGAGLLTVGAGLTWYAMSDKRSPIGNLAPWVAAGGGGLVFRGSM